jgi:hypothetical protein
LHAHQHSESQTPAACDRFAPSESTRRRRHGSLTGLMDAPPVEPLEQGL